MLGVVVLGGEVALLIVLWLIVDAVSSTFKSMSSSNPSVVRERANDLQRSLHFPRSLAAAVHDMVQGAAIRSI